jgi:hypothetical protein
VDVDVIVGATIVAVHLNGNATVGLIGLPLTIRVRVRIDPLRRIQRRR